MEKKGTWAENGENLWTNKESFSGKKGNFFPENGILQEKRTIWRADWGIFWEKEKFGGKEEQFGGKGGRLGVKGILGGKKVFGEIKGIWRIKRGNWGIKRGIWVKKEGTWGKMENLA